MSTELLGNIIAKRLSASPASFSAAADRDSKERLIAFSQHLSRHPDTCTILRRAGLAERAVDLAAAGERFKVSEIDQALDKAPRYSGTAGDQQDFQSRVAFKIGLQDLGLL